MHRPHYFFDLDPDAMASVIASLGLARFRAAQVMEWVYRKGVCDPQSMTNLSTADRVTLAGAMVFTRGQVIREQHATDGTHKLLMRWDAPAIGGPAGDPSGGGGATVCVILPTD